MSNEKLKDCFEFYQDFPAPGVNFIDVGSILRDGDNFKEFIDLFTSKIKDKFEFDKIAALESRGFLFAAPVAYALGKGLVLIRKKGKLPGELLTQNSSKEYGFDVLQMQKNAITPGEKILIIDDILATGGTIRAGIELVKAGGGIISGLCFLGDIAELRDKELFEKYKILSVFEF